ncbi:hypothetical protein HUU39_24730 [candidate division KSB1 bacterium]|nr:hypothetical protein [bacterium]NUM68439.1 hypothetical protein [candidate division KSB1 bacterium]
MPLYTSSLRVAALSELFYFGSARKASGADCDPPPIQFSLLTIVARFFLDAFCMQCVVPVLANDMPVAQQPPASDSSPTKPNLSEKMPGIFMQIYAFTTCMSLHGCGLAARNGGESCVTVALQGMNTFLCLQEDESQAGTLHECRQVEERCADYFLVSYSNFCLREAILLSLKPPWFVLTCLPAQRLNQQVG